MDQKFLDVLVETYPDVGSTGIVNRAQIVGVMQKLGTTKYPMWIMENRVGRGLYAVPGRAIDTVEDTMQ
jgi:hypothetical protein